MAVLLAGPVNPDDLLQLLASEPKVLARVAIDRRVSPPQMLHIRVQVPGETRVRRRRWYPYQDIGFWIGVISGQEAANWITSGAAVPDGTAQLISPFPLGSVVMNADRHPSQSRSAWLASPWPFVRAEWHCPNGSQLQTRFLVGPDLPFFTYSDVAIAQLVYEVSDPSARNVSPGLIIDWQDRTARIGALFISQDEIKVPIRGEAVDGLQLGVGSEGALTWSNRRINQPSTRRVPLKSGIPSPLWVVLSKEYRWLDYRYLQQTPTGWHTDIGEVEFEQPDMVTQIKAWIAGWETDTLEFKETLVDGVLEDVCAFANGSGGTILLGIRDKTRSVVGLTDPDVDRQATALLNKVRTAVDPEPVVTVDSCEVDGKLVLVASVAAGREPPYGVKVSQTRITYFVRRGGSNYEARPADLRALTEQKVAESITSNMPRLGSFGHL